ncbi:uncharacterized protein LOC110010138 isoform X1 [Jatropha curcas]|uniref:uncharacterized protein LOC110010138 isoform X1 n=1 Tax=Jatropha curcas TaxID=180498 RepID=UPI0009D6DDE7|nr:uncharacterized protein LOC110010138 isoform X1 [Jatropha curcas]
MAIEPTGASNHVADLLSDERPMCREMKLSPSTASSSSTSGELKHFSGDSFHSVGHYGFVSVVFDTVGHVWGDWCPRVHLMIFDMKNHRPPFGMEKKREYI